MAGKPQYSEADRMNVYSALVANDWQIKTAARETGIPETTVRRWSKEFKQNPPAQEAVEAALESSDYVADLRDARNEALAALRTKIPEMSGRDLATTYGILTDKLARVDGEKKKDNEHHHFHHLPPAEEVAGLLQGLGAQALDASRQRQSELESRDLREQLALPAGLPVRE